MFNNRMKRGTFLIILIGIVSLFADFTYEGSRSIVPQYFTLLGGSVFTLGIVLGVSEFFGYSLRIVSGKLADVTRNYWSLIFVGYAINLVAVPLLALVGNYEAAAVLIFMGEIREGGALPSQGLHSIHHSGEEENGQGVRDKPGA